MNILTIDTSTNVLGMAIMKHGDLATELITNNKQGHSTRLMPAITNLMNEAELTPNDLDKIVVANGPGSYTGTRIGVTVAKTLAWSLNIPIYTVSSLEVIAANATFHTDYICSFFDARRGNVFTGLYKWTNNTLETVINECNIDMQEWLGKLQDFNEPILFLSPHLSVFEQDITSTLQDRAMIPNRSIHFPRPSNLFYLYKDKERTPAHLVSPNYLRITEAEANWLKQQKDDQSNG